MKQKQQPPTNLFSVLPGVMLKVGCVNIIFIGAALGVGILLDNFFDTNAIFTIGLVVVLVPIALYLTIRIAMTASMRVQEQFEAAKLEEETDV